MSMSRTHFVTNSGATCWSLEHPDRTFVNQIMRETKDDGNTKGSAVTILMTSTKQSKFLPREGCRCFIYSKCIRKREDGGRTCIALARKSSQDDGDSGGTRVVWSHGGEQQDGDRTLASTGSKKRECWKSRRQVEAIN